MTNQSFTNASHATATTLAAKKKKTSLLHQPQTSACLYITSQANGRPQKQFCMESWNAQRSVQSNGIMERRYSGQFAWWMAYR
jgi:hypothetical protein